MAAKASGNHLGPRAVAGLAAGVALALALLGACAGDTDGGGSAAPPPTHRETTRPAGRPLTIGLWGDMPYTADDLARLPALVERMNAADLDFSVFDGDFKGGGRCDDRSYATAVERFDSLAAPVIYVPGDNEWTECHATGSDPLERLAHLRAVMFARPESFGRRTLALEFQSDAYPENTRWQMSGVVFVAVHVVGENDNKITDGGPENGTSRSLADRQAANAEHEARSAAGRAWLRDSFALARRTDAAGIMVVIQADPLFEVVQPAERVARGVDGLDPFVDALRDETIAFDRPVALVHGDTHRYRLDHPLLDREGAPVPNLVRCETFGTPVISWVKAIVDPRHPDVFRFEPQRPA